MGLHSLAHFAFLLAQSHENGIELLDVLWRAQHITHMYMGDRKQRLMQVNRTGSLKLALFCIAMYMMEVQLHSDQLSLGLLLAASAGVTQEVS